MKHNFLKKSRYLAVGVLAALALTACGGGSNNDTQSNAGTKQEAGTKEEAKGLSVVSKLIMYNSQDGSVVATQKFEYDAEGNQIKSIAVLPDGTEKVYEIKREYDADGNVVKQITVDAEGNETSVQEKEYNADGTVTTKSYSIGKLSNESVANEDGQTISSISYNISTGEVASETKYTYGSNGHVSKRETTSNGTTTVITNEYEEKDGLVVSSKAMANGAEVSHTEYEYDADGNKTKEKTYSGDTLTQELEYITIEK